MSFARCCIVALLLAAGCAPSARESLWGTPAPGGGVRRAQGRYAVRVDLKNLSGETKTDWPVILRVYTVLGRDLRPETIRPDGFHVYDPSGREVPHWIEKIPPYDQPGNDEIVFVIPRIEPGRTLSYRVTSTPAASSARAPIDLVSSPHNLIADGGFEGGDVDRPAHFGAAARVDPNTARSGKRSLLISADDQTVSTRYTSPIKLHPGSWYYFGVWSKTRNVSRYGHQAGNAAHVRLSGFDEPGAGGRPKALGSVPAQCSTRDWAKAVMRYSLTTDWGMDVCGARAAASESALEFVLQQPRHFYMRPGETRGSWWLDDAVLMEQPEVTVRFDLALQAEMTDGVFLFTRPPSMHLGRMDEGKRGVPEWCALPYAHEKLTALDAFALKGQRASYTVGLYHARALKDVLCRLKDGAVSCRAGGEIPVELIEYCPGYVGPDRRRYLEVLNDGGSVRPVSPAGEKGVRYFFLTFHVPPGARAGRYAGELELLVEGKVFRTVPVVLRVQDLAQAVPEDVFVGIIYQGGQPRFDDEGLKVYSRSGFNCITRFGNFLDYEKDAGGSWQVDLAKLHERMMWLKGYGMQAVCVFSDFDLGPKWNGGALLQRTRPKEFNQGKLPWGERLKTAEAAWKAQIARIEGARKQHPEWPTFIYMTWDEPSLGGGRNGMPDPAMAWVNQVAPDALTTLDVQFAPLPVCLPWYTVPAFDDPANWAGPEVYRWVREQGKQFGFCGAADIGEGARSQPGLLMAATGAKYFHAWHLTGGHRAGQVAYDKASGRLLRAPAMINWGDGMNDLKAYTLLKQCIRQAAGDARRAGAVRAAEEYLRRFFAVFNGDYENSWTLVPYLGSATSWGYERLYDDWQERMLRHAAAIRGVRWIE